MLESIFSSSQLVCPACSGKMKRFRYKGIELDKCGDCQGVWFDKGEIEEYRLIRTRKKDRVSIPFQPVSKDGVTAGRQCPRCEKNSLVTGRIRGEVAHHCGNCEGYFIPVPEKVAPQKGMLARMASDSFEWIDIALAMFAI